MFKKLLFATLALATIQPTVAMEGNSMREHYNKKLGNFCGKGNILDFPDEKVLAKITKYLDNGASPDLTFYTSYGVCMTMLNYAANVKNTVLAGLLLNKGANPNLRIQYCSGYFMRQSIPVLVRAAQQNLTELCTMLLEKGADAAAEDDSGMRDNGMTALMWAEKNKNKELATLLRDTYGAHLIAPKKKDCCPSSCSIQ